MKIIGIAGSPGSGKTTLVRALPAKEIKVIDVDKLGHSLLKENIRVKNRLVGFFGEGILGAGGRIDRPALAGRAFANKKNLLELNRIVHPSLKKKLEEKIREGQSLKSKKALVVDCALLLDWRVIRRRMDVVILVWAPEKARTARLRKRGLAVGRIKKMKGVNAKTEKKREKGIDFIVDNSGPLKEAEKEMKDIWKKINRQKGGHYGHR